MSNLAASFPLFFFGAGCVAAAAFVLLEGTGAAIGRIPLWVPFLALGIIALAGGTLSVFAEPDEPAEENEKPERAPIMAALPRRRISSTGVALRPREPSVRAIGRTPPRSPSEKVSPRPPAPTVLIPASSADNSPPSSPPAKQVDNLSFLDDPTALLKEIDLIAADIHASHLPGRTATPGTRPVRPASTGSTPAPSPVPAVPTAPNVPVGPLPPAGPEWLESEAPRMIAHCVGCGSVILHAKAPSQCQVCGEPLCSECRDRSLREGKPNLCPLCALLDTVHSKGASPPQRTRRV